MFESMTFENVLGNMLTYVSDRYPELDIRTGSMIYNALAGCAMEIESIYFGMDMIVEETFLETASKEYLIMHGNQIGVPINEATYGHFKGEFNVDVEIGSRFNLDEFNYNVIEKLSDPTEENPYYTFELVCETEGVEPNTHLGDLTPITYVANLSHAKLTEVIIYGEDEEETEEYRYRILTHIKKPPINGNAWQYEEWLNSYPGVGKHLVTPCWNGVNTVKLTVLNSENRAATSEFIKEVQEHFDPPSSEINDDTSDQTYPQGRGMGNGQAPIGAIVTVDTVTEVPVVIDCILTLKGGYTTPVGVKEAVEKYLNSLVLDKNVVAYMPLSAEIYKAESVADITHLEIWVKDTAMNPKHNPFIQSVTLSVDEIPVLNDELSTFYVAGD